MIGIGPFTNGDCPWCGVVVQFLPARLERATGRGEPPVLSPHPDLVVFVTNARRHCLTVLECPSCGELVLTQASYPTVQSKKPRTILLWPALAQRHEVRAPAEVPEAVAMDFNEAVMLQSISPNASAALARRCLQLVLVEHLGLSKNRKLQELIRESESTLPGYVFENLDFVRRVGNLAAHPEKDGNGVIVPVEEHETEWIIRALRDLFDHCYVKPSQAAKAREDFDARVDQARRPVEG